MRPNDENGKLPPEQRKMLHQSVADVHIEIARGQSLRATMLADLRARDLGREPGSRAAPEGPRA